MREKQTSAWLMIFSGWAALLEGFVRYLFHYLSALNLYFVPFRVKIQSAPHDERVHVVFYGGQLIINMRKIGFTEFLFFFTSHSAS